MGIASAPPGPARGAAAGLVENEQLAFAIVLAVRSFVFPTPESAMTVAAPTTAAAPYAAGLAAGASHEECCDAEMAAYRAADADRAAAAVKLAAARHWLQQMQREVEHATMEVQHLEWVAAGMPY